jgi:hypothetical protein
MYSTQFERLLQDSVLKFEERKLKLIIYGSSYMGLTGHKGQSQRELHSLLTKIGFAGHFFLTSQLVGIS